LVSLFRCGWEKRQEIVIYLQTCIPKVRRAAKRAGSLIARDWRSLQEGKG
jgi:hypothetical protein